MMLGSTARKARDESPLVGRVAELAALQEALEVLDGSIPGAVALSGEPGIGKTRLLGELAARAEQRKYLVLSGSASELERDLPFSAFVDGLDEYAESLDRDRLSALDDDVQAELAHVFLSLCLSADGRKRHRSCSRSTTSIRRILRRSSYSGRCFATRRAHRC